MGRVVAVALAVASIAVYTSSNVSVAESTLEKVDGAVSALEEVLRQKAVAINDLKARLDAQDTKVLEQAATIKRLEASVTTQQSTIDKLQVTVDSKDKMMDYLNDALQTLKTRVETQGQKAGFYADFGREPYDYVKLEYGGTVTFDRTLLNIGDAYDLKTGLFSTPVSGLYLFSLHFKGGSHDRSTELAIYVDGQRVLCVAYALGYKRQDNDQGSCTSVVQLRQGKGVSVKLFAGTPGIWGSPLTSFSGVLVRSD